MKSLAELAAIKEKMQQNATIREEGEGKIKIVVGMATCGIAAGARPVLNAVSAELAKQNVTNATVAQTGCVGRCTYEPLVDVIIPGQDPVTYVHMTPDKVAKVVQSHVKEGVPVVEYTIGAYES